MQRTAHLPAAKAAPASVPCGRAESIAHAQDNAYEKAGATVVQGQEAFAQDITLKVRPPSLAEVGHMKEAARWPLLSLSSG